MTTIVTAPTLAEATRIARVRSIEPDRWIWVASFGVAVSLEARCRDRGVPAERLRPLTLPERAKVRREAAA